MARYDRIALLPLPTRASAFPCWSVLRDIEAEERDPDLARRVRLRFLALRPVRRLLGRGADGLSASTYQRQIDGVREELGQLPARDPERVSLAAYLHRIRERKPAGLAIATLQMAESLEAAGHPNGAEEYAHTGLDLADAGRLDPERLRALQLLARIVRAAGRWDESRSFASTAAELALEAGDALQWARSMKAVARAHEMAGDAEAAVRVLTRVIERGQTWRDDAVVELAAAELCLCALGAGTPERAVTHGWLAFRLTTEPARREDLLDRLGTALVQLGLYAAADRCYHIISQRAADPVTRAQALAARASVAAEAGWVEAYGEMRDRLLSVLANLDDAPRAAALILVDLARGALRLGATDATRDHAREAIRLAQAHGLEDVLERASGLLTALEAAASGSSPAPQRSRAMPGPESRRIAAEIEALEAALVPASH